jgi:hypothetical protein
MTLGRHKRRREVNIKMDIQDMGRQGMDLIHPNQIRER